MKDKGSTLLYGAALLVVVMGLAVLGYAGGWYGDGSGVSSSEQATGEKRPPGSPSW